MNEEEQKEIILELLQALREYLERVQMENPIDRDSPTKMEYLNRYIHEYSQEAVHVSQLTFVDCHDPKKEDGSPKGRVRSYMYGTFKPFVRDYFLSDEGMKHDYKLEFPEKGYELILIKNNANEEKENGTSSTIVETKGPEDTDTIFYNERIHFETKYGFYLVPVVTVLTCAVTLLVAYAVVMFFLSGQRLGALSTIIGILSVIFASFFIRDLFVLMQSRFASFSLSSITNFLTLSMKCYFLKLAKDKLLVASYTSMCPLCDGSTALSVKKLPNLSSYIAKCSLDPDSHQFTFSHSTLKGIRIE